MTEDVLQLIKHVIQRSLQLPMKFVTVQTLMSSSRLDKTRSTPLMAQPYEVINVTGADGDGGDQGWSKSSG